MRTDTTDATGNHNRATLNWNPAGKTASPSLIVRLARVALVKPGMTNCPPLRTSFG